MAQNQYLVDMLASSISLKLLQVKTEYFKIIETINSLPSADPKTEFSPTPEDVNTALDCLDKKQKFINTLEIVDDVLSNLLEEEEGEMDE